MAVPEFILRKLVLPDSFHSTLEGAAFTICNTFAPGTLTGFQLEVDGQPIPPSNIILQVQGEAAFTADSIRPEIPFKIPVGVDLTVTIKNITDVKKLHFHLDTVELGALEFNYQRGKTNPKKSAGRQWKLPRFLQLPLKAEASVDVDAVLGEINPFVYGQFIEHLERCIYDGIWTTDGSAYRQDTLALIKQLHPPMVRYPGGNFASGYHWEDGIGPRNQRPTRFDAAWNAQESNQVGTDEFMEFCHEVDTAPYLCVNDGSGTPEEAARWVGYCNQPADGPQGRRRAANGHPQPYDVKLWGVGNEVWGAWQIGTTTTEGYAQRLLQFIAAMRAEDPTIEIVAVGATPLSDSQNDPAARWNRTVLEAAGDQIDYLSFHIYQPGEPGWQEHYDQDALFRSIAAAPLDTEDIIQRIAAQIDSFHFTRPPRIAVDEWNVWFAPPPEAKSMHGLRYTQRDILYVAGMLNVFHRTSAVTAIANLAQLVNVLPLIITSSDLAVATTLYYPFLLYNEMEKMTLQVESTSPTFAAQALGENITQRAAAPYLDLTATCNKDGTRVVIGLINRSADHPMQVKLHLSHAEGLRPTRARVVGGGDPLAENTLEKPGQVIIRETHLPIFRADHLTQTLPPCSVTVWELTQ